MPESQPLFSGIRTAAKYNPHLWNAEELRAIFVVRRRELDDIIQALRNAKPEEVPQHRLFTGSRGMGKTTLLQRTALAVEDDEALRRAWIPLRFPEEQYTVGALDEFWANVLDALGDALERQGRDAAACDACAASIGGRPREQREAAVLRFLDDWCDQHQQRLLLLVDSTDLLFGNLADAKANRKGATGKDQSPLWQLRRTLSHNHNLFWLGGSYQALEAESLYQDAFLDFFHTVELRPLKLEEMRAALCALARAFGAGRTLTGKAAVAEINKHLDERPERLKTLAHLTGGNPRTTVLLYELFATGGADDVKRDLEGLLDMMTPLYKARIETLAEQPRKLLAHIMEHWDPISLGDLARISQIKNTSISPQLQRLERDGLIQTATLSGTTRRGYQISERFFNIWYLMRNAPRRLRTRLAWLVEFLRLWYSGEELVGLAQRRLDQHRSSPTQLDHAYSRALAQALPEDHDQRLSLEWTVFQQAREDLAKLSELFDLEGEDQEFKTPEDYLQRLNAIPALIAQSPLPKSVEEKRQFTERLMSSISFDLATKEHIAVTLPKLGDEKFNELKQTLEQELTGFHKLFGKDATTLVFQSTRTGQFFPDCPNSRLTYTQIIAQFANNASAFWFAIQLLSEKHQDTWLQRSLNAYQKQFGSHYDLWVFQGRIWMNNPNKIVEAEQAFIKASQLAPDQAAPWNNLGNLLQKHPHRYDEAEQAYRKAIALDKNHASPWNGLGHLLQHHLRRYAKAEQAYRKAISLDKTHPFPWYNLGNLLQDLHRYDEAEHAYRKAIYYDKTFAYPWNGLGHLFQHHHRYEEAEHAYREAIARDKTFTHPWNGLGHLLQYHLHRYEEAEQAYREVIAHDKTDASPWHNLGNLFQYHLHRYEEAEQAYREAIARDKTYVILWNNLGDLLQSHLHRYKEAEQAYQEASRLDPKNPYPLANLARLQALKTNANQASAIYRTLLKGIGNGDLRIQASPTNSVELELQAHLWLGNRDAADQALSQLVTYRQKDPQYGFHKLKEQAAECHQIGKGPALADLMENNPHADFLQPFSLALRAASGDEEALRGVAPEIREIAEQVSAMIVSYRRS